MCERISGHDVGIQCREPRTKCKSEVPGRERPWSNAVGRQLDAEVLDEHVVEQLVDFGEPSLFRELLRASAHADRFEIEALISFHKEKIGMRASADDVRMNRDRIA